jgi:hypothetical protein
LILFGLKILFLCKKLCSKTLPNFPENWLKLHNIIIITLTPSAWSPALRDGVGWNEYLIFNLGGIARITRIKFGQPTAIGQISYRIVTKVLTESPHRGLLKSHIADDQIPSVLTLL